MILILKEHSSLQSIFINRVITKVQTLFKFHKGLQLTNVIDSDNAQGQWKLIYCLHTHLSQLLIVQIQQTELFNY